MDSNKYIFIYATVMVVIVAIVLSTVATVLKPIQQHNIKTEKIQNILSSVNIESTKQNAPHLFEKYITKQFIVKYDGSITEGDAFGIDMKVELRRQIKERQMPLYLAQKDNNGMNYIIPLYGRGLWGPLWGYIALGADFNIINGVVFDHKGETPGLGAEISTVEFSSQFISKEIFDANGAFVSVDVVKTGNTSENLHAVDGISGGTITSVGVAEMLRDNLMFYLNFYNQHIKNAIYE